MNTLFQKLKDTYLLHPTYNNYKNYEELYPLLRKFLLDNIRLGDRYIAPSDFSETYAIDFNFINEVFLSLANEAKALEKYYYIFCDSCSEYTITKEVYDITQCVHCGNLNYTENLPQTFDEIFNSVKFIYMISPSVKQELVNDLKGQPSSFVEVKEEGNQATTKSNPKDLTDSPHPNLDEEFTKILDALSAAAKEPV